MLKLTKGKEVVHITGPNIGEIVIASLNSGIATIINFIPKFLAGIILLLIGFAVAAILKRVVFEICNRLQLEGLLKKYGVPESGEEFTWTNILAEITRWFIIILFLIPTADVWGLPQIVTVLNTFLLYLPNVFVAAIIAVVGFVFAKLSHNVVLASTRSVSKETSKAIASVIRWAVIIFVLLAVLNQFGVAVDLIRIFFTGFVAMVAIAGGIAFGLGGKELAKTTLEELQKRLK
jgi:purine-cytosine permease-like protein